MSVFPSLVFTFILFRVSFSQENVTVTSSKGVIVGMRVDPNPSTGVSYDAFLGIPYGQIPTRFQPSVPRSNWNTPLVAHSDGPMCPQPNQPFSEDCLYLNVFTKLNASQSPVKYPVMVFIHGGGFTSGSSSSLQYGPDFLVINDVILVTMNYRLGAAGFLTLGTAEAPGNLGLYDTALALQWVRQEIAAFGGDPSLVTLFGHSAGSIMTMAHYLSPVSSGLFNYTIGQSGPALTDGHLMSAKEAVRRAKALADAVGCNSARLNGTMLLDCLQKVDIGTLVTKQNIPLPIEDLASGKTMRFKPVMDIDFAKQPFFPDTLDKLMDAAVKRSKPLVTGFATEDGIVKFQDSEEVWKLAEGNLESFIPWSILTSLTENTKSTMAEKIKEKYFPATVDQNKILDLVNLYTDTLFAYPTIKMTRAFANFTYGYVYSYRGAWNPMPSYFTQFKMTGVFHGAELTYLFYSANSSQDMDPCRLNYPCIGMALGLGQLWANFSKTGSFPSEWGTVSKGQYLVIDTTRAQLFINSSELEERHYRFWANMTSDNSSPVNVVGNLVVIATGLCSLLFM